MTKYNNFKEIVNMINELFEQKKYEECIHLLTEDIKSLSKEEIEKNYFEIIYVKAILYSICKKYDECFEMVKESITKGYAYPIKYERYKPIYDRLKEEGLVEINEKLLKEIKENAKTFYQIHLPKDYDPTKKYPLFIALHGDGLCSIEEFSEYFKPDAFIEKGYIFAYLQSSQTECHQGYGWCYDIEVARKDIRKCYNDIINDYPVDVDKVIIGGFSGGAIASVDIVMSDTIPVEGFICLSPEETTDAFTNENVRLAVKRGVKGVFMEGEKVLPIEDEDKMMKAFDDEGLEYKYYIHKGIGHAVPNDINDKLIEVLNFIESK